MLMRQVRGADEAWSFDTLFARTRAAGETDQQMERRRPLARGWWDDYLEHFDAANELSDGTLP